MSKAFEIKDLGSFMYFLGGEVAHLKKGIMMSQRSMFLIFLRKQE